MSLQTYMQEQASTLARRARKRAAFDAARDAVARDDASGVTTESLLAELDAIRGPWPEQKERGAART
ncbi:MAG: hypothetical protein GEU97_06545 [Actinophytocola sp.]|nr:hypothetical protein [Actinophytocola sp.]